MTGACGSLSQNVQSMHGSLVRINTDYLNQIADLLHQMQQEAAQEECKYILRLIWHVSWFCRNWQCISNDSRSSDSNNTH